MQNEMPVTVSPFSTNRGAEFSSVPDIEGGKWELLGEVGVDCGNILIADAELAERFSRSWTEQLRETLVQLVRAIACKENTASHLRSRAVATRLFSTAS
jgi:hypothetical protein